MRIIVAIPTTGRPDIVEPTVLDLARQTRLPDLVVVVVADAADINPRKLQRLPFPVCVIESERGASLQRNTAMSMLHAGDLLFFQDDDFVMAADYLQTLETLFAEHPDVVMATGNVLADGIHGPGLDRGYALDLISNSIPNKSSRPADIYNCYGCNMAMRADPILQNRLNFDIRLKLYAWLEDVDFSRQMAPFGRIVKSDNLRGVHLGTKVARSKGLPLGYSQISNPIYLINKGTMSAKRAVTIMSRNLAANLVKSLRPEPEVDRVGRLKGNVRALTDLLRGKLKPENAQIQE